MKIIQITLILIFSFISSSLAKEYIKDFKDADFIQSKYDVKNDWFKNEYGKTSHISSRELREYLEKKYGKCPKGGWQNIHIKEEDI